MKTFHGYRRITHDFEGHATGIGPVVHVRDQHSERELPLRLDLRDHSPTGFEWGYGGSGPAQLALAILAEVVGPAMALRFYQPFKWRVVSLLAEDGWTLTSDQVANEVLNLVEEEGRQT